MELIIDRLTKKYDTKLAVDRVSGSMRKGVYGLLGANGAGKTTLMRMICGILNPTEGSITYDGINVNSGQYRAVLGYLPQDFGYYPEFTAEEFLLYISSLKGLTKSLAKTRTRELLEEVSLSKEAKRKIKTFSGGMKQRLGIAQAIINDPEVLILDEPTAGLDPKERVKFRNLISRLGEDRIVLLSTHIVSDIEDIAGEIMLMKDGRIAESGTLEKVIKTVEGRVWECEADRKEASLLMDRYTVINIRQNHEKEILRLISDDKPSETAVSVKAGLEDLYLYYFAGEETL